MKGRIYSAGAAPPECRSCGCTDNAPCVIDEATGALVDVADDDDAISRIVFGGNITVCHWIEVGLCSGCVRDAAPPLLYDAHGNPLRGAP
jgi:hypothetical protein